MTTLAPIPERSRTPRWLSIAGIVLVPLVVAGLLIWALWNPADRLDTVNAAVVNDDTPVEVDGQTVPLGRQLSAELVGGDVETNYTWTLTSDADAAAGLEDGTYAAVVTIPSNFSEAATSFGGDAADAERALIDVTTSDKSRLIDDAISQTITQTAATLTGRQLTETYLDNIYIGFNTLGDQLGDAADGATELADGAVSLADGAAQLAGGTTSLADGASALATGAASLSTGVDQLASGAATAASGANDFASQLGTYTGGVAQVSDALTNLKQQTTDLPETSATLASQTATAATGSATLAAALGAAAQELSSEAAAACALDPVGDLCAALTAQATALGGWAADAAGVATAAGTANGYAQTLAGNNPDVPGGLPALAGGVAQLSDSAAPLGANSATVAAGAATLAGGVSDLSAGVAQLQSGASELSSGAADLSSGAGELATGATGVTDGSSQLSTGTGELASGLGDATEQLPTYSDSDRENLSTVVADPVSTSAGGPEDAASAFGFGASSLPLYTVLALWIGALATFIVLGAYPKRMLESTRPSVLLALRSFTVPGIVGAVQGLLVAGILGIAQGLEWGAWFGFAGVAILGGVAFAAVNQALVAWFGGAGRFVSMVIALVVLGTGVVSTAPGVLDGIRGFLPVEPVIDGIQAIVGSTSSAGALGAAAALIGWTLLALVATVLAVARKRTVPVRRLAAQAA